MNHCACCNLALKTNSTLYLRFSVPVAVVIQGLSPLKGARHCDWCPDKGMQSESGFCLPASCCLIQMSILKAIQIKLKICNYIFPFNFTYANVIFQLYK